MEKTSRYEASAGSAIPRILKNEKLEKRVREEGRISTDRASGKERWP